MRTEARVTAPRPASPSDARKGPRTVRSPGLVSVTHRRFDTSEFVRVEAADIFAERTFARSNRRPIVVKVRIRHADHQLGLDHLKKALFLEGPLHLAGCIIGWKA